MSSIRNADRPLAPVDVFHTQCGKITYADTQIGQTQGYCVVSQSLRTRSIKASQPSLDLFGRQQPFRQRSSWTVKARQRIQQLRHLVPSDLQVAEVTTQASDDVSRTGVALNPLTNEVHDHGRFNLAPTRLRLSEGKNMELFCVLSMLPDRARGSAIPIGKVSLKILKRCWRHRRGLCRFRFLTLSQQCK